MSSDEEYELDAEQVMEELQAKEEQLRLAAEFGQTLLERSALGRGPQPGTLGPPPRLRQAARAA
jgi:hypothetical protein